MSEKAVRRHLWEMVPPTSVDDLPSRMADEAYFRTHGLADGSILAEDELACAKADDNVKALRAGELVLQAGLVQARQDSLMLGFYLGRTVDEAGPLVGIEDIWRSFCRAMKS
jgi:hypothetical protein